MSLRMAIAAAMEGSEVPGPILEAAFVEIMDGNESAAQMAALLIALRCKGETVGEIVTAAKVLRSRAVMAPSVDPTAIDTCGTGGDGAGTFNISTIQSLTLIPCILFLEVPSLSSVTDSVTANFPAFS